MPARRLGLSAALLILLTALVVSAAAQPQPVIETKLENGLTVLMKESRAAAVVTAQVWFRTGSRNEHTGITGISHLLEHMLFKSSKNYKQGEITRMVRERGGIDNAATWTDFTYYWVLLSSEHLDFALEALAERLGNALLLEEEFEKERTVVLSELQGHENNPDRLLYQAVMAAAFKAHPYRWPVIGWQSDVENVTRDQLAEYYARYYHPNNATLVLVGDFDPEAAMRLIRQRFGGVPSRDLPPPVYTVEPVQRGERTVTIRREGSAERVMIGYHIPSLTDPDIYPIVVLDRILSGGRSGRLYQALVETRLAVSAWSSSGGRRDPSLFLLGATAQQGVTAQQIEQALLDQVEKARSSLPTDEELQAAKNQLEAYFIFQNDSVSDQGEQLGYYNTLDSWRYLDTLIPNIKAVTAEQVRTVAAKYLTRDNMTAGRFIPTDGGGGGAESEPPAGSVHALRLPDAREGVSYYAEHRPVAAESAVKAAEGRRLVEPHREVLDNGMVVIVHENHSNPTVAIAGNLKAGSCFDPPGKSGTASLTAEMLGRGTASRTALELARAVEFVGASLGASAGVESANFNASSLARDFDLILELLADQLRNPVFPQDQFENASARSLSRLEQSKESPRTRAFRAFNNSVFPPGHPYHEPTFDQAERELRSITRDDLVEFHRRYYRPDTTIITIVGDVDARAAVDAVKKYFGDWKADGPAPVVDIPTVMPSSPGERIVVPMADKSEASVVFGHAFGVRRSDPDFYAVRIMNQILGGAGALASLLGEEIREKQGLVYNVYSAFDASLGAGPWYASLGTSPKDVDRAVDTVKSVVERFREEGPTQEQFEQAREFIVGVFPIALETNAGIARAILSAEFNGLGMDFLANYAGIYRGVTLEQVRAAAAKYLRPDLATLVIAGPYEGN